MGLFAPAPDGKEPFIATSCRYKDGIQVLYTYHAAQETFSQVGQRIVEQYASHIGTAMGIYQGHPAAFMSYLKVGP